MPETVSEYEVHEPRPADKRRAIVSVAFPSDDFAVVSKAARDADMKLSEFIRVAAINATKPPPRQPALTLRQSVVGTRIGPETMVAAGVRVRIERRGT